MNDLFDRRLFDRRLFDPSRFDPRHSTGRDPVRIAGTLILAGFACALAGCTDLSPQRVAGTMSGYASRQLCAAVFVSGLDPDEYFKEAIAPRGGPLHSLFSYSVDREQQEVSASLAGTATSRSDFRGPLGCIDWHGQTPSPVTLPTLASAPPVLPPIAGPGAVSTADPAMARALARAFEESPQPPYRRTKAIVVVQHGRVVAERYAPGIGVATPLLGWSATKSVVNALLGVLAYEHKLDVQAPAPIAAWSGPGDPRHAITVDNLLRMTSGLDLGDTLNASLLTAFDKSAQMTFLEADMAAFAERAAPVTTPGTTWTYADGNTLLLSRIVRDAAGGDAASAYAFMHRALFDKLGMEHVTVEFDAAGTPIGASRMLASARDWARFGVLYLHDGVVGGERILPAGWVDYSATLTPGSEYVGYGAGFWTNRADTGGARKRRDAGMPRDAFMARGTDGQYVIVIPSHDLVITRFGNSLDPTGDIATVDRLVAEVIAALPAEP